MSTKVLVFESEPAFAEELKDGLLRFGCETTVVDDANVGLQAAANDKPDLILLSIELPRMNGFSVCNKLKRNPELKQVPLIIMSSDSTEETFEQHRRLRTRAEDYVHKPIAFGELLKHIREFLPLTADMSEVAVSEDAIVIDDDLELEEAEIDAEVEDFAEQAFDALIEESPTEASVAPEQQPKPAAESPPAAEPAPESLEMDEIRLEEAEIHAPEPGAATDAPAEAQAAAAPAAVADEAAQERVRQLEQQLQAAQARSAELEQQAQQAAAQQQELRQLREELDSTQAKLKAAASGKAATSAREFLDLREALNKKDKELLELRDQLTHKERELLNLKDGALALDREKADLDDRILELEKQALDHERLAEALRADKDQAAKRADDFKRKAERLQGELEARARELTELKDAHTATLAQRDAAEANLRVEHQQALEQAQAQTEQEVAKAIEESRRAAEAEKVEAVEAARAEAAAERERILYEREGELKKEFDSKMAALHRANEDARSKLRAEHEQAVTEWADREVQLTSELASANESLANLHKQKDEGDSIRDAKIGALESELTDRTRERDEARSGLEERDSRIVTVEAELASTKEATEAAGQELTATREKLERATRKWNEDRVSLEGAKDALAAALARIEEVEQRPIE